MKRLFLLTAASMMACQTGSESQLNNPLLAEWSGPYGGVPPFDKVEVSQFEPAIKAAMARHLEEIDSIVATDEEPTFDNTIAALERSGAELDRFFAVYGLWSGNFSTPEFQEVETRIGPLIAAHSDRIIQNGPLYERVKSVYENRELLNPEQQRIAWLHWNRFRRAGAELDSAQKSRVVEINAELASLFTKFNQNLLADEDTYIVLGEEDLAGLPPSLVSSAASSAKERGVEGHIIVNTRSSVDPYLTYAENRDTREKVWRAFVNRGDNGGETDNKSIITQILKLRAERANILGYKTHAHWRLEDAVAKTPENAMNLMEQVWPAAVARVREEVAEQQAIADREGAGITIEPWDYHFYMEKVRKEKFDLDQNEIKPYLQLDKLRDGMFWAAGQLYGFQFSPAQNVPVAHPDIQVWEVKGSDGQHVGLFYFDPFARQGKRSGAWMNSYRVQEKMDGDVTVIVTNNSNFVKGEPGEPVLISWDDATTLFHEFGHALHGLNSNVTYPSLSGTAVSRDYVEFPSQLMERWLSTSEVLNQFAVNADGEPIPQELVDKIKKAATFNQGFGTTEYLASALVDMKLHLAGATEIAPDTFERNTLAALGMPSELVMRHRTPQFGHVFSSDGYSAGYYSYLWADAITADASEAFSEAPGSFYDTTVARKLRENILSVGNTIDPAEAYRNFRGRDPDIGALMRARGFPASKTYKPLKAN